MSSIFAKWYGCPLPTQPPHQATLWLSCSKHRPVYNWIFMLFSTASLNSCVPETSAGGNTLFSFPVNWPNLTLFSILPSCGASHVSLCLYWEIAALGMQNLQVKANERCYGEAPDHINKHAHCLELLPCIKPHVVNMSLFRMTSWSYQMGDRTGVAFGTGSCKTHILIPTWL